MSGAARYRLYGLTVESPIPLPCPACSPSRPPDVRLLAGQPAQFETARQALQLPAASQQWFVCGTLPDGRTYLRWAELFEFLISPDARTIAYARLRRASNESFSTYLLGQVLSFSLLAFGYEPLHATTVLIDGKAVAFLGDCGYGKSTIGAAFVARGHALLTDDVLALERQDGKWIAHAGPPRLKLFPSVARKVLARGTGSRLNPGTSKLVLPLSKSEAGPPTVPLRSLYILPDPAHRERRARTAVRITPVTGQDAFLEVTRAAFNLIQVNQARLKNQFAMATNLVREVPVRRLEYPRKLSSLGAVCDAVVQDVRQPRERGRRTPSVRGSSRLRSLPRTRPTRARR